MSETILFLCPHNAAKSVLAAALLVSSALHMVQAAAGGRWHGVGVALGLFLVAYFMHVEPILVILLATAVGMLIL